MRAAMLLLAATPLVAQPVLREVLHASTGEAVSEARPAVPGETLLATAEGMAGEVAVLVGEEAVAAVLLTGDRLAFTLPDTVALGTMELAILSDAGRSNAAAIPVAQNDPSQLSAAEVDALVSRAALALDHPRLAIAVTDRAGRPLAIYRRPEATDDDVENALALARTGAFFSHNQAPLSSRTVRALSRENFPKIGRAHV